jgi:uncharacterized coiled-coil protein SlyX
MPSSAPFRRKRVTHVSGTLCYLGLESLKPEALVVLELCMRNIQPDFVTSERVLITVLCHALRFKYRLQSARRSFMATRRTPRVPPGRRANPLRQLVTEQQRAAEAARSRARVEQLKTDLPLLIEDQVGEHFQKLEDKLLKDFQEMGQKAIEQSTSAISDQLNERIETLEEISALKKQTITTLRDTSKRADQKVSSVVDSIEKSLSSVVPGFQLEPSAFIPSPGTPLLEEVHNELIVADSQELEGAPPGKYGFCPKCTSKKVRRAYRHGLWEEFLRLFFIAPFRCRACRHKFYRF